MTSDIKKKQRKMSKMDKRKFTAKYKAKQVIEMLREEVHISEMASREGISRTQLQNWKKEYLEKAPEVFAGSKTERGRQARAGSS